MGSGSHLAVFCLNNSWEDFPGGPVVKNSLPMQGTRVWPRIQEDPLQRATKLVSHSYWSLSTLEPVLRNKSGHHSEELAPHS